MDVRRFRFGWLEVALGAVPWTWHGMRSPTLPMLESVLAWEMQLGPLYVCRVCRRREWRAWWAWHPVRVEGHLVWLGWVARRQDGAAPWGEHADVPGVVVEHPVYARWEYRRKIQG